MQNQKNKTINPSTDVGEKRLEAQRALEGDERIKAREEATREKAEDEQRKKEKEERMKQEKERGEREEEEKKKLEENRKKEAIEKKEREEGARKKEADLFADVEEKKKGEEVKRAARQEALLKRMRPPGKEPRQIPREEKVIERVPTKTGKIGESKIPRIRTYKGDVAEAIKNQGESLAKIALAEKKKVREEDPSMDVKKAPSAKKRNTKMLVMVAGLVIVAVSGTALVYQLNKRGVFSRIFERPVTETTTPSTKIPTLIVADTERKINIPKESVDVLNIIAKEMEETSGINSIKNIYLLETKTITTDLSTGVGGKKKQVQKIAGIRELLSIWPHTMPTILSRSLYSEFMLGIYSTSLGINTPFLILTTNSYEQTFAGMFEWEKTLRNDFYNLFGLEIDTTAKMFRDVVIVGNDARILKNARGETTLIYSFIDEDTVIITTKEETFDKILSGLR